VTDVPQVRSARNGDVHLAYKVLGDKPHDVVLVWGGPNHLDLLWESTHLARLLRRFTGFARLIHFDQRGTGLSDRIPVSELPTLDKRAADIEAVMDAAGSERAVILGESDGGLSAMFFAATYPERTAGLALWGTLARGSPDDDYPWAWSARDDGTAKLEVTLHPGADPDTRDGDQHGPVRAEPVGGDRNGHHPGGGPAGH
jgi:pimeloyl-ACP methyl ester carboxylesterase